MKSKIFDSSYDHAPFWLVTVTSIKSGGAKLDLWVQTSLLLCEMMRSCNYFPPDEILTNNYNLDVENVKRNYMKQ